MTAFEDLVAILRAISTRHTLSAAEHFGEFDKPVLVAWATEDRLFPLRHAERLADAFPNARLERIQDSYTFVSTDQPERTADLITSFAAQPRSTVVEATTSRQCPRPVGPPGCAGREPRRVRRRSWCWLPVSWPDSSRGGSPAGRRTASGCRRGRSAPSSSSAGWPHSCTPSRASRSRASGRPRPPLPPNASSSGGSTGVRNPMYLAVAATILGQMLVLGQPVLLVYAGAFAIAVGAFVHGYAEPTLARRFGDEYEEYRSAVPAWLPRRHAWKPAEPTVNDAGACERSAAPAHTRQRRRAPS